MTKEEGALRVSRDVIRNMELSDESKIQLARELLVEVTGDLEKAAVVLLASVDKRSIDP